MEAPQAWADASQEQPIIIARRGEMIGAAGSPWCHDCPLRRATAFQDFNPEDLRFIASFKSQHRFSLAHSDLILDGEKQSGFMTLFSGWAFSYKILFDGRRQILSILLPGDTLGLDAVVFGQAHSSVQALTDVATCVFEVRSVAELCATRPSIVHRMLWRAAEERRRLERQLTSVGVGTTRERLVALFLDLHARLSSRGLANGPAFAMPLTQHQVADHLGVNVVHINRVLRGLREEGLLSLQEHTVVLRDPVALKKLSAGFRDEPMPPLPLI
jgi:CRP/FNR family transcriptional regulator, anaerobic regulatory protein